jgi:magnesium/cobalt transport protein CorA
MLDLPAVNAASSGQRVRRPSRVANNARASVGKGWRVIEGPRRSGTGNVSRTATHGDARLSICETSAPDDEALARSAGCPAFHAVLFDAVAGDQRLTTLDVAVVEALGEKQLLWVDLLDPAEEQLRALAAQLSLPPAALDGYLGSDTNPCLDPRGKCFWLRVVSINGEAGPQFSGTVLTMVAGPNLVITLHHHPVPFLEEFRSRQPDRSNVGELGAASFVSALLDWQLGTYFEAVSRFEIAVERLEVDILSEKPRQCLAELRSLRKGASRLRRMLAPHRVVYTALARPDFRPEEDERTEQHFRALDTHYERAMDMVENARDLVVGSFELFSSQTALTANETMKVLTFATVVIGILAVLGGVLGMNFETPFFKTGTPGFAVAIGLMLVIAGVAIWVGKRRQWL